MKSALKYKCGNMLALLFLLSSFVPLFFLDRLEGARVPAHFNYAGFPDRWDNGTGLQLLPFVACFVYVLMLLSQKWPGLINFSRRSRRSTEEMYAVGIKYVRRISVVVMLMFSYLANSSLVIALGYWSKIPSGPMYAVVGGIVLLTVMFYREVK